jgi:hypothetical protein
MRQPIKEIQMDETPAYKNLINTMDSVQTSDASKEEKNRIFFEAAINFWNEDMAGDVELVNGKVITIETI